MASDFALWVKTRDLDALRPHVPDWLDIQLDTGCAFARIGNSDDFDALADELEEAGFENILLGFQSDRDAFSYARRVPGREPRILLLGWHGEERTWEHVSGRREPWESWSEPPVVGKQARFDARQAAQRIGARYKLTGFYEASSAPAKQPAARPARKPTRKVAKVAAKAGARRSPKKAAVAKRPGKKLARKPAKRRPGKR